MYGFSPGDANAEAETHKEKTIRHPFHSHTLQLISLSRTSVRSDVANEALTQVGRVVAVAAVFLLVTDTVKFPALTFPPRFPALALGLAEHVLLCRLAGLVVQNGQLHRIVVITARFGRFISTGITAELTVTRLTGVFRSGLERLQ